MDKVRWIDLLNLKRGAVVVFVDDWDIFPTGIVPAGTRACVTENVLNETYDGSPYIGVTPITPVPGLDLQEWDGQVYVKANYDIFPKTAIYNLSPLGIA